MVLKDKHIKQPWETFFDFCEKRFAGIKTGIKILDEHILGLRGIVCIRGAPGTNKSTLALQIAKYYAEFYGPVLFYDRENGFERLRLRLLSQHLNLSEVDITIRAKNDPESLKLGCAHVDKLPFRVVLEGDVLGIEDRIKTALNLDGRPPLLVIDSIQKLGHNLRERRASLDQWLYDLDSLKVKYENNVRILFTSEKNYQGYYNPGLGGSKDSSEIEYTAETILDLRPHEDPNKVICFIAKDRDGISNVGFNLERVLSDPNNSRSFCYALKGVEEFKL